MTTTHTYLAIAMIALVTALLRFLPALLFSRMERTPRFVIRLGQDLPKAALGMLVIYCLKDLDFTSLQGYLPATVACVLAVFSYAMKKSSLFSVLLSTIAYMLIVNLFF